MKQVREQRQLKDEAKSALLFLGGVSLTIGSVAAWFTLMDIADLKETVITVACGFAFWIGLGLILRYG